MSYLELIPNLDVFEKRPPKRIELNKPLIQLGRKETCDVLLNSSRRVPGVLGLVHQSVWISREHAKILVKADGSFWLVDTSSTGSYVDNIRVTKGKPTELKHGCEIFFGSDAYKYRLAPKFGERHPEKSDFFYRLIIKEKEKNRLSTSENIEPNSRKRRKSPENDRESICKKAKIICRPCDTPNTKRILEIEPKTPTAPSIELRRTKEELEKVRKERDEMEKQKNKIFEEKRRQTERFEKLVKEKNKLEVELEKSIKDFEQTESALNLKLSTVEVSWKQSIKEKEETQRQLKELEHSATDAKKEVNVMERRLNEIKQKQTVEAKKLREELASLRQKEQECARSVEAQKKDILKAQNKMRLLEQEKMKIRGNLVGELENLKRDRDQKGVLLRSLSVHIDKLRQDKQQLVVQGKILTKQSLSPSDVGKIIKLQREIVVLKNHVAKQNKDKEKLKESLMKKEAAVEKMAEELECGICCEFYNNSCRIATCGHAFCSKCLGDWMVESGENSSCPTCRKKFEKNDILKAFDLDNQVAHVKTVAAQEVEDEAHKTVTISSPPQNTQSKISQQFSQRNESMTKKGQSSTVECINLVSPVAKSSLVSKLSQPPRLDLLNSNSRLKSKMGPENSPSILEKSKRESHYQSHPPPGNPAEVKPPVHPLKQIPNVSGRAQSDIHSTIIENKNTKHQNQPIPKSFIDLQKIFQMAQSSEQRVRQRAIEAAKNLATLSNEQSEHLAVVLARSSRKQAWDWVIASLTPQRTADLKYIERVVIKNFPMAEIPLLQLSHKLNDGVLQVSSLWHFFKLIPLGPGIITLGLELLKAFLPRVIKKHPKGLSEANAKLNLQGWFRVLIRTLKELEKGNLKFKAAVLSKSLRPVLRNQPSVAFSVAVWFRASKFFQCALEIVDQIIKGIIPPSLKQDSSCIHTLKFKLLNDVKANACHYNQAYNDCLKTNPAALDRVKCVWVSSRR